MVKQNLRVDEIEEYYHRAQRNDHLLQALFWLLVVVSIFIPHSTSFPPLVQDALPVIFITGTVFYTALSLGQRFVVVPRAEIMRREQFLSNAFEVNLTHKNTKNYYNNDEAPSMNRVGANTFENSFFTKEISGQMASVVRIIVGLYFFVWIASLVWRSSTYDWILVVTQTVFSAEIIAHYVSLEALHHKSEQVFQTLYDYFLQSNNSADEQYKAAKIINQLCRYESAKAVTGVLLSSRIFHKRNQELSAEWERIKQKVGL